MGEALITRRGGGSFKMGTISTATSTTLSDPALVGAKNAVVYLADGATDPASGIAATQLIHLVIENGEIVCVSINDTDDIKTSVSGVGNIAYLQRATFNAESGKITLSSSCYTGRYSSSTPCRYDYIVFD